MLHQQLLEELWHPHDFAVIDQKGERRMAWVLALTFVTMALEIVAGVVYGSMALLADGWHMATHAAAFLMTLVAYRYSRIHADDGTFAFGPGKVGALGGFAGAIALAVVALMVIIEAGERLLVPRAIHFDEALLVAALGLAVNLVCALLLGGGHDQHHHDHHDHHHAHGHHHHHRDNNLKAAYLHVLADALTSVLAIAALLAGKFYGWDWLDPVIGMVGALVIASWSYGLLRETGPLLVDESLAPRHNDAIRQAIESDADNRVADLHSWRVGPGHFAVIVSVVSHHPKPPGYYKALLERFRVLGKDGKLSHVTVEVHRCPGEGCPGDGPQ